MAGHRMLFQRGHDFRALDNWSMALCDAPVQVMSSIKEPYKNDWPDEHGDEEWNETVYYSSYELEFTFAAKTQSLYSINQALVNDIRDFVSWLNGGEFMFWCEYGNIGRQNVRYAGYSEDAEMWQMPTNKTSSGAPIRACVLRFTLKLKVNDPITRVVPNSTYTGLRVI